FSRDWSSDVCSSDLPQFLDLAQLDLLGEVVERDLGLDRQLLLPLVLAELRSDLLRLLQRLGDVELVARVGNRVDARQLQRRRGRSGERRVGKEWRAR